MTAPSAPARSRGAVLWHRFASEIGPVGLAATPDGLARLSPGRGAEAFRDELEAAWPDRPVVREARALEAAERQVREYLAAERTDFDLPLDLSGLGTFARDVLRATRDVPFGEVASYGEIARRIGRPGAARAVGAALGRNPLPLVIPCHRIVRSDGTMGGYSGGAERKRRLLALEGALPLGAGG